MRTERRCQAMRWIRVRPGWFNRPALDRFWRNRGERSGECGGDGLLCPLLGSRLYGCIGISALCLRHVTLFLSLPLCVSCDLGFLKKKFERENGGCRKDSNEEWVGRARAYVDFDEASDLFVKYFTIFLFLLCKGIITLLLLYLH